MRLRERTALVTGAGRGIGRAVAMLLASEGASVVVNDPGVNVDGTGHDAGPADQVVDEITAAGGKAVANYDSVAELDGGEAMVKQCVDAFGRIDILVNVAGILRDRMIFNMTEEEWDAVVRVHMKGTYATTRFASIHWRQRREGGRLINFTSGSGLFGAPGQPNYAAAKMGIWGFTLSCARALARYGVTSNSIGPGAATRMTDTVPDQRRASTVRADDASGTERDPANVAVPIVYLASDDGGWINGRCFGIRGYQVTLYSQIKPEVVLQGNRMWTVDEIFEKMPQVFGSSIPKVEAGN